MPLTVSHQNADPQTWFKEKPDRVQAPAFFAFYSGVLKGWECGLAMPDRSQALTSGSVDNEASDHETWDCRLGMPHRVQTPGITGMANEAVGVAYAIEDAHWVGLVLRVKQLQKGPSGSVSVVDRVQSHVGSAPCIIGSPTACAMPCILRLRSMMMTAPEAGL